MPKPNMGLGANEPSPNMGLGADMPLPNGGLGAIMPLPNLELGAEKDIISCWGYENPCEATSRIVCANCHLANKPVGIEVPQAILSNTISEVVVQIP
uniref:Cytochrome f large domain-containing protein n=1 Tax=Populus trichocarpa TaxID=3694 RepID=B9GQZ7_POPTR